VVPTAPGSFGDWPSASFLLELMLKVFHYVETPTTEHLAKVMCLPIKLVNELLESLKTDRLIEIIGGAQYGVSTAYKFRLTEKGEERAERALERCRYAGAAPVTLEQYERVIGGSDAGRWRPSVSMIKESFKELILDDTTADFLERALHSGRSLMLYGPSGNGKTTVLTEFIKHLDGEVLIPNALYAYGQIIRMFDGMVHKRVEIEPKAENGDGTGRAAPMRT
jgi:predicted ATPase with chaperone activity